ncbi:hypothetical protein ACFFRR_010040 [Megaselia abdita]
MTDKAKKSDDGNPKGSVVSEEEMAFYKKLFPSFDIITKRKIHCTVCRGHLGCAPGKEDEIKMHPVLRVMQCTDCHEFYSSGEFSRGEDGSELYCRWCGQGGQVYCCSSCPYVFCKSCIVENLNKGVVRDIEENDSWNCFSCSTKIIWPLRAMHWALTKYIAREKELILKGHNTPSQIEDLMALDNSTCCKNKTTLNKTAIVTNTQKRRASQSPQIIQPNKKTRSSLPMNPKMGQSSSSIPQTILEPTCQITTSAPPPLVMQGHQMTTNVLNKPQQYRIPASIKQTTRPFRPTTLNRGPTSMQPRMSGPRSTTGATSLGGGATTIRLSNNQMAPNQTPIQRRQISTITATTTNTSGPVYHTINGYRIDLNSASKQDNFRLPNGKLIQVKRQVPVIPGAQPNPPAPVSSTMTSPTQTYSMNQYIRPTVRQQQIPQQHQQHLQQQLLIQRNPPGSQQFIIHTPPMQQQQQHPHQQQPPPAIQYRQIPQLQPANQPPPPPPPGVIGQQNIALKSIPNFVKQIFPSTPLGVARNTLQSQLFHTMEICHHLMTKTHTMTNSNAYKTVHNLMDIKELYIHLSYLLTYAIGRFKGLQDKCLNDMKALGFTQEARNLEKGQLAKDNLTSANDDDLAIVEPQRDTIELDSDVEDDIPRIKIEKQDKHTMETTLNSLNIPNMSNFGNSSDEDIDLNVAADLLAGMLEVELTEGDPSELRQPKVKMPRTKTTKRKQRPNSPTTQAERAKIKSLQGLKNSDAKLKMNCVVLLERIDVPPLEGEETAEKVKVKESEKEAVTPKDVEKEKTVDSAEASSEKETPMEVDPTDEEKKKKEEESKKPEEETVKEKVIELDSADEEKNEKTKDPPSEDSDKVTVIELDDDEEKNDESKKPPSSPKPSVNEVIDLDDDDEVEKEKTKTPEKTPPSSEVIDLDDDEEDKMSVDGKSGKEKDIPVEEKETEVKEKDKTEKSPEKSNDVFEISEDEEEVNDKSTENIQNSEKKIDKNEPVENKSEENEDSKKNEETPEKMEVSFEKEEEASSEKKEESNSKAVEKATEVEGTNDEVVPENIEDSTTENEVVQEEDSPKINGSPKSCEKDEETDANSTNDKVTEGTEKVLEIDTAEVEEIDPAQEDISNDKTRQNDDEEENKTENSDDTCQSPGKQSGSTNRNGKVYIDGKELDEGDFESSSSESEDEEDDQGRKESSVIDDNQTKDSESKETPSNGFGSENSTSNFDLIESMIKENLSVPTTTDTSKLEEGNNGMLTAAANEI